MDTPSRKSTEQQQLQHSGDLGLEKPVDYFDKTQLPQAFEQHLTDSAGNVIVPDSDSIASLAPETEAPKKNRKLMIALGGGAAAIAVAAGAIFSVSALNQPEKSEPIATAPADPSETSEPTNNEIDTPSETTFEVIGLPSVEELQVKSNLSDQEIASGFLNIISEQDMAGANKEMNDLQYEGDNQFLDQTQYSEKIAESASPIFAEALYGDNQNNPEIQAAIAESIKDNANVLEVHFSTYGSQNTEQYKQELQLISLDSVVENDDGTITYTATVQQNSNESETIIQGSNNGYLMEMEITVDKSGDIAHLTKPAIFVEKQ